jgi:hypothetical protein
MTIMITFLRKKKKGRQAGRLKIYEMENNRDVFMLTHNI